MNESDLINGIFEFVGGVLYILSIRRLLIDKEVKGFSVFPHLFFTSWGLWNLIFYPVNGLMFSFYGGVFLFIVNVVYLALIYKYINNKPEKIFEDEFDRYTRDIPSERFFTGIDDYVAYYEDYCNLNDSEPLNINPEFKPKWWLKR